MSYQSENVKRWRKRTKERIIQAMGGKCCLCGYNRCNSALALHHLDPSKKDFSFGAIRANAKNWKAIVKELRKCVLVCHVCHSEIHEGVSQVPHNAPKFNEDFADYKKFLYEASLTPCSICGKLKTPHLKNCSLTCAGKSQYRVPWDSIDLVKELESKSVLQLAHELGCSDGAIHKRLRKLGLK